MSLYYTYLHNDQSKEDASQAYAMPNNIDNANPDDEAGYDHSNQLSNNFFSNLNGTIIMGFALLYIMRRTYKSKKSSFNIFKGCLRSLGVWFMKLSICFEVIFLSCLTTISKEHVIDKSIVELSKKYKDEVVITLGKYTIDLSKVMIFTSKTAGMLLSSSIYFIIALILSKSNSARNSYKNNAGKRLCAMWGITRMVLYLYFDLKKDNITEKVSLFILELLFAIEYMIAGFALMMAKSELETEQENKVNESIGLLAISVFFYGILKHAINLIDLPFNITEMHLQILNTLRFALLIAVYFLCVETLCPHNNLVVDRTMNFYKNTEQKSIKEPTEPDVSLIRPMIEFHENLTKNYIN